jgi:hypothetical protein
MSTIVPHCMGMPFPQREEDKTMLKLNGKPLDLNAPTPALLKIKDFLDRSAKDDVFTLAHMKAAAGVGECTLRDFSADQRFAPYSMSYGRHRQLHFGHPSAIAELKRMVGAKFTGAK